MECSKFKVIQWNCNRIKPKQNFLFKLVSDADVFCLQETWLTKEDSFHVQNYNIFRKDRDDNGKEGGGLMFGVKNNLQYINA